jgi:DNA-binding GntR family transcriptional regulator
MYRSAAEIADHLAELVRIGHYQPDQRLAYAELTERYDCPPSRIQRAMWLLRERGVVDYRPGLGHFVRGG